MLDDTFPIAIVKTGLRVMDRFTWFGQPHGHMIIAYDDTHFWVDEEWYGRERDELDMTAAVKFHKLVGYSRYNKTAEEQIEYLTRRIGEVGHNIQLRTIMQRSLESIKAGGDRPGKIDASDIVKEMSYKVDYMSLDDLGIYSWPKPMAKVKMWPEVYHVVTDLTHNKVVVRGWLITLPAGKPVVIYHCPLYKQMNLCEYVQDWASNWQELIDKEHAKHEAIFLEYIEVLQTAWDEMKAETGGLCGGGPEGMNHV